MTILLISHDLQWMSKLANKITVMYCGQTVETASPDELLVTPYHPYTQALIRSIPDFTNSLAQESFKYITRCNSLMSIYPWVAV